MRAVVQTAIRTLEVQEVADPAIEREVDVLLKIEMVGVCGSDMHRYTTGRIGSQVVRFPYRGGHECAATVLEVGSAVTRVKVGDQVAVDPAISCGTCDQCLAGRGNTCRKLRFLGCPGEAEGCLCEYLVMPQECLYPVTGRLSLAEAVMCEPFSIAIYAVKRAQLAGGADVAVLGAGPIGLSTLLSAQLAGVGAAYMTEKVDERVKLALKYGPSWVGNPDREDVVKQVLGRQPAGMDVVFECAGQQETIDQGIDMLKPGGRLMLIGIPCGQRISVDIDKMRRKEITVMYVRRQSNCVGSAIELIASRKVDVASMVTHKFDLEQAAEAFDLVAKYRDGVVKALIQT